jgi:sugar lactone lactonase YvrE
MNLGVRAALLAIAVLAAGAVPAHAVEPLSSFGSLGEGAGELDEPTGVAVGLEGSTYVADQGNHRIAVFAPDGSFLRAFGRGVHPGGGDLCGADSGCQRGTADAAAGALNRPWGIALGPDGNLYVADSWNRRIAVFGPDGTFLHAFGKGVGGGGANVCTVECQAGESDGSVGSLSEPKGLAFDAAGLLYVADYGMHRVAVFTAAGEFVRAFGKNVAGDGKAGVCTTECHEGEAGAAAGELLNPTDVAPTADGLVAVSDAGNHRVAVFTAAGEFVRAFGQDVQPGGGDVCTGECQGGAAGAGPGAISTPEAVEVDATGVLSVAEWGNVRVSRFGLGGEFLDAFGVGASPFGLAFDCRGALYVAEWSFELARVQRFGEPGTPPPPCSEPVAPISLPASAPVPVASPESRFQFGKLVLNRWRGTATLYVFVPGPGTLWLRGNEVQQARRRARRAGLVKLPVRPRGELKRKLRRKGRAKSRVRVTFRPVGGVARTRGWPVRLRQVRR